MRKLAILGAVLAVLAVAAPAQAATKSPVISGSAVSSENGCAWISMVLALSDCSYSNRMLAGVSGDAQWIGPTFGGAYYTPGSAHAVTTYTPVPGDDRIAPAITGTLNIDDLGTPLVGTDDTIGGTIVWGAAARSIATGAAGRVVEQWTGITHTLAPTVVDFATANANGGFDYIIGNKGNPGRLCAALNPTNCFPSQTAPGTIDATTIWAVPSASAISIEFTRNLSNEGVGAGAFQSRGATTTAVIADYACATKVVGDCTTSALVWGNTSGVQALPPGDPRETPGYDNLILLISTNADGDITAAEAYWTQEYFIGLGILNASDNSAAMGYFTLTGVVPGAKSDTAQAESGTTTVIDVLANDVNLVDPVAVTIAVVPDQGGSAVVNGSPGTQAAVNITYTSAPGFTGTETFTYQVDDGALISTAVVTVTVVDSVPNAFTFLSQTNVALSTVITSAAATISGLNPGAAITVANGQYSIGCTATYTAAAGTINNGQDVCVRQTSAAAPVTNTVTTLTIGGVNGTFTTTTVAADTTPAAFSFTPQTSVALNSPITSNAITVTSIDVPVAISVVGGQYAIGTGAFTAGAGTVSVGQTVTVRQTSSATPSTPTSATVTIGGVPGTFTVTTEAADTTPTAFSFTPQTNVAPDTAITSNAITVAGINQPAAISVVGGQYAIGAGAFTAGAGTVSNGQTVTVRQTSAIEPSTATTATVTIGGVAGTFTVTTAANEVLVIDGGSSALDPWSLVLLGGLPLLRRRRKAALKLAAVATVAAVSVLAAPGASAAETDRWDWDYDGLYLGAGVNGTTLETSDSITSDLGDILGLASGGGNFEDFPVGGQVYAGWMFNRYLGLEGRWSGTDDGESNILTENLNTGDRTKIGDAEISLDGWTAYGVANWPVAPRWDLFGKVGYTWQTADISLNATGGGSVSDDTNDNGVAAALGARWRFAHHWAATVEGEYLDVNFDDDLDEPWRASLNIEYWFGGHELAPPPPPPAKVVAAPPPPPAAPKDSDGDGVVDGTDQCPETPKGDRVGAAGCSCDVTRQLQFAFDSAKLTDADKLILDEMAENLTRLKFVSGTIAGYTDSIGTDAYNKGLSERRAKAVADYLEAKGIAAGRMQVEGMGEADPIGDNKTAEGRTQNRRVVAQRTDCDQ